MYERKVKISSSEYVKITKMLLKGMTIQKIAEIMNYSESTVSNRLNYLFQKYSAKNRFEFVYNFFSEIIKNYKIKLRKIDKENKLLKTNFDSIKSILSNTEKYSIPQSAVHKDMHGMEY